MHALFVAVFHACLVWSAETFDICFVLVYSQSVLSTYVALKNRTLKDKALKVSTLLTPVIASASELIIPVNLVANLASHLQK